MIVVLYTYGTAIYKIKCSTEADLSKIQKLKRDLKRMGLVFFTIGVGWLSLILVVSEHVGLWADWVFIICKLLQPMAFLVASVNLKALRARCVRNRSFRGSRSLK